MTVNNGWTGRVIDGRFPLRQWMGGSDRSGVFVTELKDPDPQKSAPQKAVIRVIPADYAMAQAQLARWDAAAKLSHPHVMKPLHMGQSEVDATSVVYCVTEYADEVLADVLKDRPLTPDEVQEMLVPVLDALSYLHGKGFVHGHLRPSNVLVVNDNLQLSGDGLEAAGEPSTYYRKLDVYDAPEAGRTVMTPAADVWSLGMMLVTALTQKPAEWDRARDLYQEKEPAVPEGLPEPFAGMARRCLRIDPAARCALTDLSEVKPEHLEPVEVRSLAQQPTQSLAQNPAKSPAMSSGEVRNAAVNPAVVGPKSVDTSVRQDRERKNNPTRWIAIIALVILIVVVVRIYLWPHTHKSIDTPQATTFPVNPVSQAKPESSIKKPHAVIAEGPTAGNATAGTGATTAATPGGGVAGRVMPQPPESALHTIHGTVRVSIQMMVDASGDVTNATFASVGPSRYFANMALAAARRWKFAPGSAGTRMVEFDFTQGGVTAKAE